MSTCTSAGVPGLRGGCTRASTNVGDVTAPSTSIACAIPLASTVFPAPSGPESTTTSPARRSAPSRAPNAMVSSAVGSSAVPSSTSAMVAGPVTQPTGQCGELGGCRTFDQAHQRVVDDLGLLELDQMSCAADDHQLALRQSVGDGFGGLLRCEEVTVAAHDQGRHLGQDRQCRCLVVHLERMQ